MPRRARWISRSTSLATATRRVPPRTPAPPQWNYVASHFQPTLKLLKLVRKYGLKKKDLKSHFKKDKPKLLVDVRHAKYHFD